MIHANDLKQSMTSYQSLLQYVEGKIKSAAEKGRTRVDLDVAGRANLAETLVPELKQKGYLAYVDYGNTSQGGYKVLRVSWKRDASSSSTMWEDLKFFMNF